MDIITLSQLGEGTTLEYKRNTDSLDSILKSIVAFANTAGGILLIGIEDDGQIVGVSNTAKVQEKLANSISNAIKPQIVPEMTVVEVDNKAVIAVQVEYAPGSYYLSNKGQEKGTYIRLGNSNHIAGKENIAELKRQHKYASFDRLPCGNVSESDLDLKRIRSVYAKRGRTIDTNKLISLGILTKKGKHIVATNGGVILFGLPETRERYFPYAEVRCARFEGTTRAEFIDRLNIEGGILSAIDEVPKFIRRNTKMAGKFGEMRRRDIPEYPTDAVRETLVNAIAHANYEISGSRIFVAIYDDKLEIQNPGIMLPGMSIEQFKAGVSRIRNPVIAKTLGQLELVEEWGSGYKRIKEVCEKGGYPLPNWEEFGTALRVTFYPHPEVVELSAGSGTQLAPSWHPVGTQLNLDDESLQLIDFCRKSRAFQEMQAFLGWKDRTKFRRRFVIPMFEAGILARTIPEKPRSSKQRYFTTEYGKKLLDDNAKDK